MSKIKLNQHIKTINLFLALQKFTFEKTLLNSILYIVWHIFYHYFNTFNTTVLRHNIFGIKGIDQWEKRGVESGSIHHADTGVQ